MNRSERHARGYKPASESLETRVVLTSLKVIQAPHVQLLHNAFFGSLGYQLARPNAPVAPFAATSKPTFVDPSVAIIKGKNIAIGQSDYVAPNTILDASNGYLLIGTGSSIGSAANVQANPTKSTNGFGLIIGDSVLVGAGATLIGPGVIGASKGSAVQIGANAVIDQATIQPGAEVGALARVEPGIVIKTGFAVLPGADVTTQAEAQDPTLGKVVKITVPDSKVTARLTDTTALATGYTGLYQGQSATGPNAGTTSATVFNGSLAPVKGSSPAPGTLAGTTFSAGSPKFLAPANRFINPRGYTNPFYTFRLIGAVTFPKSDPFTVEQHVGKHTTIRADIDQPISIGAIGQIGEFVSIHGDRGSKITIGDNLDAGNHVVITGEGAVATSIGNDVSIGDESVVNSSTIGNGAQIGANVYIANSTIAPGQIVPAGSIIVNSKVVA